MHDLYGLSITAVTKWITGLETAEILQACITVL